MKKRRKATLSKKIARCEKAVTIIMMLAVAASTVISMIPKNEKIENVNTDSLIDNASASEESSVQ